ncbi:MAG: alpha-xylosidase [Polyangiaceae bacterium]|nr:alpha-xylosidase [Polyangiaceae bacterium]
MKFKFGDYALLPGISAIYPLSIIDVEAKDGVLTVTGYDKVITKRSEMLDGTIITARFSSPAPDVLRVELTHFKGKRPKLPSFQLTASASSPTASVGKEGTLAWLKTGNLAVEVNTEGPFRIQILRSGEPLTSSETRAIGLFTDKDGNTFLRDQLSLDVGETVYGLGEHFGPFVKNGQSCEIWNEDGGTNTEWAYKNVPFYVTSRGYGVLVNNPGRVSYEVASHQINRVQFSVPGHSLDYFVFGGPTIKSALEQYTALTGRPPILPEWSYGLWLSTSFLTNYNEAAILENLERMEKCGIKVGVFHFDCFWMKGLTWSSFVWDPAYFPDPQGLLQKIQNKGVKVCLWINPYIAEASALFDEGARGGYLLKTPSGDVYQEDRWQPGLAFVDFTNPAAREWFAGKLRTLIRMGVDTFKTDFGERIPTDVQYFDGSDPERMHNYYTYLYNETVFNLLREEKGEGQAIVFARSATAGNQKFPVHWSGDNSSSYVSMAETLRGGLSFGLTGFGFWSHDISGFYGTATPDLYKRWVAFGMLSSHSRLHGSDSVRMPWMFGEASVEVLKFFTELKQHLMPYLLDVAKEAHDHGWPMMRAMVLEFPNDPACQYLDRQYMLGAALLVAPVFQANGEVSYYVPAGKWRHLLRGEEIQGPAWRTDTCSFFELPLLVRADQAAGWACLKGAPNTLTGNSKS